MKVYWKVSDGYVGHGEHVTIVNDDELADCLSDEERELLIEEVVQADFEQKVSFNIVRKETA